MCLWIYAVTYRTPSSDRVTDAQGHTPQGNILWIKGLMWKQQLFVFLKGHKYRCQVNYKPWNCLSGLWSMYLFFTNTKTHILGMGNFLHFSIHSKTVQSPCHIYQRRCNTFITSSLHILSRTILQQYNKIKIVFLSQNSVNPVSMPQSCACATVLYKFWDH